MPSSRGIEMALRIYRESKAETDLLGQGRGLGSRPSLAVRR
jgi:hypothetical protein